jgi:predicted transcriptional regulator
LDGVSLDQLRSFIAAVDEGSFSAAARKLRRAQSAVSELVSSLEDQMGVMLSIARDATRDLPPRVQYCWRTPEASWLAWIS